MQSVDENRIAKENPQVCERHAGIDDGGEILYGLQTVNYVQREFQLRAAAVEGNKNYLTMAVT